MDEANETEIKMRFFVVVLLFSGGNMREKEQMNQNETEIVHRLPDPCHMERRKCHLHSSF